MIKLEKTSVFGFEAAIRGMRNPHDSWEKGDSKYCVEVTTCPEGCMLKDMKQCGYGYIVNRLDTTYSIGPNDHELAMKLAKAGGEHAKYRRMIDVAVDITAPRYWWTEFDTYKIGTVANSCSTMHTIHKKKFSKEDFSHERIVDERDLIDIINKLNWWRYCYLENDDKKCWHTMIQLLPQSYNQKRTVHMNYEVLSKIYLERKTHKLDEWREFCDWIETLPYSEIMTLKEVNSGVCEEESNDER